MNMEQTNQVRTGRHCTQAIMADALDDIPIASVLARFCLHKVSGTWTKCQKHTLCWIKIEHINGTDDTSALLQTHKWYVSFDYIDVP